jgi:hypothetical protein
MAAQRPDIILLREELLDLYTNPLEDYWALKNNKRPEFIPTSYCKRGYIATWEIADQKLFLKAIDGHYIKRSFISSPQNIHYSMSTLFPNYNGESIMAFWFTGKLRIPYGSMKRYAHQGYESRFEREILINVEHGVVKKEVLFDFVNQKMTILNGIKPSTIFSKHG